jgi:hypothetical protein
MKKYLSLVCVILCLSLCGSAHGDFDLREAIGESAWKESGLEKLTKEERKVLESSVAKLLGKQEAILRTEAEALPQGEDRFGLETVKSRVQQLFQSQGPERIESRLTGPFKGWNGRTQFRLENGQVWRQSQADTFVVKEMDRPEVVIRRGRFGGYLLQVKGYNSSVKVERVK